MPNASQRGCPTSSNGRASRRRHRLAREDLDDFVGDRRRSTTGRERPARSALRRRDEDRRLRVRRAVSSIESTTRIVRAGCGICLAAIAGPSFRSGPLGPLRIVRPRTPARSRRRPIAIRDRRAPPGLRPTRARSCGASPARAASPPASTAAAARTAAINARTD